MLSKHVSALFGHFRRINEIDIHNYLLLAQNTRVELQVKLRNSIGPNITGDMRLSATVIA